MEDMRKKLGEGREDRRRKRYMLGCKIEEEREEVRRMIG